MITSIYRKIIRIKPLIRNNKKTMDAINSCFEVTYSNKTAQDLPSEVHLGGGFSRDVYTGFGNGLKDPLINEQIHLCLKLRIEAPYQFISKDGLERGCVANLPKEIGYLESLNEGRKISGPNILGIVAHHRYNICGLLEEDYTKKKTVPVIFDDEKGILCIPHLKRNQKKKFDVKSILDPDGIFLREGTKYFQSRARIDLF